MWLKRLCSNDKKDIFISLACIVIIVYVLMNLNQDSLYAQRIGNSEVQELQSRKAGRQSNQKMHLQKVTTIPTAAPKVDQDIAFDDLVLHAYQPIAILDSMSRDDLETLFHTSVISVHATCTLSKRYGRLGDGGYDVCLAKSLMSADDFCLVYSFGVGDIWGFDTEMANVLGCEVRAFDPFVKETTQRRGLNFWFFDEGIADHESIASNGKRMRTFSSLIKQFGHVKRWIDVVKIDIEQSEWSVLDSMLDDGSIARIKQLILEIHTDEFRSKQTNANRFRYFISVLRRLEQFGFRRWRSKLNERGRFPPKIHDVMPRSCCYELYYINIKYLANSSSFEQRHKPNPLKVNL